MRSGPVHTTFARSFAARPALTRCIAALTPVAVTALMFTFPPGSPVAHAAEPTPVRTCAEPQTFKWPDVPPPQDQWCHNVLADLAITPLDGGLGITWKPLTTTIPWWCGPGGTLATCPINQIRVLAIGGYGDKASGNTCITSIESGGCTIGALLPGQRHKVEVYVDLPREHWLRAHRSATPCCAPPLAPGNVQGVPTGNVMDVTWEAPKDWRGATELRYTVSTVPPTSSCQATGLACRLTGLPRDTPLQVQVTAANSAGSSPAAISAPVSIPKTPPAPPTDIKVAYRPRGQAVVSWTPPADTGGSSIGSYTVESTPGKRTCTATGTTSSCRVSGLTSGRSYVFTVRATNGQGPSDPSVPAVAGVLVGPPSQLQSLTATAVSTNSAQVTWSRPASTGGSKILRYVVTTNNGDRSCSTQTTACTITGLARGVPYTFTAYAITSGGNGKPATATVTIPLPIAVPPKPEQDLT